MIEHTFLFQEGEWKASGTYWTDQGVEFNVEGRTTITHGRRKWVNDGFLRLLLKEPVDFYNRYEIEPFGKGKDWTSWTSYNPKLGTLRGRFMVVDDCILSNYASDDGVTSGYETMQKLDTRTYRAWGFAFSGSRKLSSWAVEMRRTV